MYHNETICKHGKTFHDDALLLNHVAFGLLKGRYAVVRKEETISLDVNKGRIPCYLCVKLCIVALIL